MKARFTLVSGLLTPARRRKANALDDSIQRDEVLGEFEATKSAGPGFPKAGALVGVGCDSDSIAGTEHTFSRIDGTHPIMALGGKTGFVGRDDFGRALLVSSTPLVRLLHHVCRALPNGGSPR
jgi:hypothetical protein